VNQALPLSEQLRSLEHIQELDLKIDSIKKSQSNLPTVLKALDDSIAKEKSGIDAKKAQIIELEKVQRQAQAALDLNRDRMARSNTKLEGVQNSQEFQAANKEIDQLKKLNGSLEEQTQKSVTEIEAVKKALADLETKLQQFQVEREREFEKISGETGKHQEDLDTLLSERQVYASKIERPTLALYDRVRNARHGLGIVPSVGGRCKGCNMMLPPQLFNEVQRCNAVQSCPSCHRLLFLPVSKESSNLEG
jgi:predicted  nucleic acid-binding Zn-ribbon protein